jgi:hypothetical protein
MRSTRLAIGCLVAASVVLVLTLGPTQTVSAAAKSTTKAAAPAIPAVPPAPMATHAAPAVPATPATPAAPEAPKTFPYTGYIKLAEDNGTVYVRSGPGLYYYPLLSLPKDTQVTVQEEVNGWCALSPVEGIYGLAKKGDVTVSADGKTAAVSAESARVYASSKTAARQWAVMVTLKKGDVLKVLEPAVDDLLKVLPPEAARMYVMSSYVAPGTSPTGKVATIITQPIKPDPMLEELKKAEAALADEQKKPLGTREYGPLAAAFKDVAAKAERPFVKDAALQDLAWVNEFDFQQKEYLRTAQIQDRLERGIAAIEAEYAAKAAANVNEGRNVKPDFVAKGVVVLVESLAQENFPIKYMLVNQKSEPQMLLQSEAYDLGKYVGKLVGVRGPKEWLKQWTIYVVTVTDIEGLE